MSIVISELKQTDAVAERRRSYSNIHSIQSDLCQGSNEFTWPWVPEKKFACWSGLLTAASRPQRQFAKGSYLNATPGFTAIKK